MAIVDPTVGMTLGRRRLKCSATNRAGERCGRWAVNGSNVCHMHGAHAPQVARAAAERRVIRELFEIGAPTIADPLVALQSVTSRIVAWMEHVESLVGQMADNYRFLDEKGAEQLRSEVALLERAYDRAGRFLADWIKLGLDERMVKVQEQQVALIRTALERVFDAPELAITDAQREAWPAVVSRELRLLEAG